ncbi:MAG: COG1615 family transporter, partial [Nitrospirales bacterium]|nr:COG1615 family transporter [Nitrospirales bacterium]
APVNRFTPEGLPEYVIRDIPPVASFPELRLDQPRIYFGEETQNHVYVKTRLKEFDFPKGDTNAQNTYDGKAGVTIDSFMKKLVVALQFDGLRLFTTQELTPESRILFRREVSQRVRAIAPFITFDKDLYHVIAGGKIYFIWDGYTTASTYPYSQPVNNGVNYIRNSVKAVVDAYDGTVDLYVADKTDPVIQAYGKAFPSLFKPLVAMPQSLRAHLRYPEDLLNIQGRIYTIYHMSDPGVFYNREDAWEVSRVAVRAEESQPIPPYYLISRLPDSDREEFVLTLLFSPYSTDKSSPRNNMVSMLMARCDGDNYGKLMLFKFPKDRQVYGPLQIGIRINQDETISKDLTLWNQQGSQIRFGNLLAVPLSGYRIMYVQPIYIQAAVGKMPELRRVVVVFGDRLAYGSSFEEALGKFFPQIRGAAADYGARKPQAVTEEKPAARKGLIESAARAFDSYRSLMGKGKYEEAGKALEELGRIIKEMQ